jgi:hypothetical protein
MPAVSSLNIDPVHSHPEGELRRVGAMLGRRRVVSLPSRTSPGLSETRKKLLIYRA